MGKWKTTENAAPTPTGEVAGEGDMVYAKELLFHFALSLNRSQYEGSGCTPSNTVAFI